MINFGKYAVLDKPTYHFKEEPDLFWTFRYATSADELAMARFYDISLRTVQGAEDEPYKIGPHWIEIMHRELAILFDETNIADGEGKIALKKKASVAEVEKLLREMPQGMVEELWIALGEAVVGWGPVKPQKEAEAGPTSLES